MSALMRAKLLVTSVSSQDTSERVTFRGVSKSIYADDGLDEENTYAKFTPTLSLDITITNPALLGKLKAGQKFYVDFVPAPEEK